MRAPPFAAVYFDCDSTLSSIEGVDELLRFAPAGRRDEVLALTQAAMEGRLPLAEVYDRRLQLLAPRREQLAGIGELYVQHLVPDAALVVRALQHLDKRVGIVSGGMLAPVQVLARQLQIAAADVHAVPLQFAADGSYLDFDRRSPLWQNGGKLAVLQRLPPSHRPLVFVGDGATDLETQGTADRFVGFGGVTVRPKVKAAAECWCETPSLAGILPFVLAADELDRLAHHPDFGSLLQRADN